MNKRLTYKLKPNQEVNTIKEFLSLFQRQHEFCSNYGISHQLATLWKAKGNIPYKERKRFMKYCKRHEIILPDDFLLNGFKGADND